jgi:hypothetical protein
MEVRRRAAADDDGGEQALNKRSRAEDSPTGASVPQRTQRALGYHKAAAGEDLASAVAGAAATLSVLETERRGGGPVSAALAQASTRFCAFLPPGSGMIFFRIPDPANFLVR